MERTLGYRIHDICEATGLSRSAVVREVERAGIRQRKIAGCVLLDPVGVRDAFGFGDSGQAIEVPPEILRRAQELVG